MELVPGNALQMLQAWATPEQAEMMQNPSPPKPRAGTKPTREDEHRKQLWRKHREIAWDTTTKRQIPLQFMGLKPVTNEPWADDALRYDDKLDRIGENKNDIQAQQLKGQLKYNEAVVVQRNLRCTYRHFVPFSTAA